MHDSNVTNVPHIDSVTELYSLHAKLDNVVRCTHNNRTLERITDKESRLKHMDSFAYFAHQPILNREKQLHAYELLFRNSDDNVFPNIEDQDATDSLVANSILGQGMDMLNKNAKCFVNFPLKSLQNQLPSLLSPDRVVIEVLETVPPTDEVISALASLRSNGYTIALDDYIHHPEWENNLHLVDIIKFDLQAQSWDELIELKNRFSDHPVKFLAERVETAEDFKRTFELGFDYFQGYFFSKPTVVKHRQTGSNNLTILQLLKAINEKNINFDEVENLLSSDVVLSYKLLNVVNNKLGYRGAKISSLRQAAIYLGDIEFKKFIALISASGINSEASTELSAMAITRAYFCDVIYKQFTKEESSEGFMLGLFSLLEAMLEQPLEQLLKSIPLTTEVEEALINNSGTCARVLQLCELHEQGDWTGIDSLIEELQISTELSYKAYATACIAAQEMIQLTHSSE